MKVFCFVLALLALLLLAPLQSAKAADVVGYYRTTFTTFAGEPTTICPTSNHAVDLDLGQLRKPSFTVEPPSFYIHTWFSGEEFGSVVTHQVPIGDFEGPHPFFGPDGNLL